MSGRQNVEGKKTVSPLESAEVISSYTRRQAIEDGVLVDVSHLAGEAGFRCPVALTHTVFDRHVRVPEDVPWQDQTGRLWDILWMLKFAIGRVRNIQQEAPRELHFELFVQNEPNTPKPVTLKALVGPGDNAEMVMTIMLPEED